MATRIMGERSSHRKRYRQIATVFARHGLGSLVNTLGLERFVPLSLGRNSPNGHNHAHAQAQHLRMAFEELGATFIKLGQVLSTRADLLSPEYQAELAKLQDAAPQVATEAIQMVIVEELGRPIEEIFASFDPVPIAAASIGQAHAAVLHDGTEVIVKVRRPGVVEQVENDLEILQNLAAAAVRRSQMANQYDLVGLTQEFAQSLRAELDYIREGRNAVRFAHNCKHEHGIHIPRVFWEQTTSRVLTLERIRGIKITDLQALDAAGINRKELALRAARIILKMVFEDGFFHADPHAGNFFVEPGGRIGLIDFGMVGTVSELTQERLVSLVLAVTSQDADRLVDAFLDFGVAPHRIDRALLRQDLEHLMARYYGQQLGDINVTALMNDSFSVVRHHYLQLPSNLAMLVKTMAMDEGLGVQLDPSFNLATVLAPYAEKLIMRRYSPVFWAKQFSKSSLEMAQLSVELPQQVHRIISDIERGGLEVGMRPEHFEPIVRRFERLANRIVLGILAAAFINGLAILLSFYRPPAWEQWTTVLFPVGLLAALALGIYLAWSILRSGHLGP